MAYAAASTEYKEEGPDKLPGPSQKHLKSIFIIMKKTYFLFSTEGS
jgi:hypothetical protein